MTELVERFAGHTPGPWKVGEYRIESEHGPYGTTVARVADGHVYDEYDSDLASLEIDNPADAALIEAAPELLAEIERLTKRVEALEIMVENRNRAMRALRSKES